MAETIFLQRQFAYGHERLWPLCAKSRALCELSGKKLLNRSKIKLVQELGFNVVVKRDHEPDEEHLAMDSEGEQWKAMIWKNIEGG